MKEIKPFTISILRARVRVQDIVSFPVIRQRRLREVYRQGLAKINTKVRCVDSREAGRSEAIVNCVPEIDLAGNVKVLVFTENQAVIGAFGLCAIQTIGGTRTNSFVESVPSPSMDILGEHIWGEPQTSKQWSRAMIDVMETLLTTKLTFVDGSGSFQVKQWKIPKRVRHQYSWNDERGTRNYWIENERPNLDIDSSNQNNMLWRKR